MGALTSGVSRAARARSVWRRDVSVLMRCWRRAVMVECFSAWKVNRERLWGVGCCIRGTLGWGKTCLGVGSGVQVGC